MSLSAISCRAILYTLNAGNAFIPTHKLKYWRTYHHHHQILRNRTIISVLWNKVLGHGLPELRRCWRQTLPPVVVSHWPSARHLTLDTGQAWPRITPADTSAVLSIRHQAEYLFHKREWLFQCTRFSFCECKCQYFCYITAEIIMLSSDCMRPPGQCSPRRGQRCSFPGMCVSRLCFVRQSVQGEPITRITD